MAIVCLQALRVLANDVYRVVASNSHKELKAGPLLEIVADWLIRRCEGSSAEDASGAAPIILARLPLPSLSRLMCSISSLAYRGTIDTVTVIGSQPLDTTAAAPLIQLAPVPVALGHPLRRRLLEAVRDASKAHVAKLSVSSSTSAAVGPHQLVSQPSQSSLSAGSDTAQRLAEAQRLMALATSEASAD
jgi:hypothetical protein